MDVLYSFIVPVFNRPNEIRELLKSISELSFEGKFETIIVEDGSSETSEAIVKTFSTLDIKYFYKKNSGPGSSRNYGMHRAKGMYYLILDSDVVLPKQYLNEIHIFLKLKNIDFFGGPDTAHPDFSNFQKAVDYTMTSLYTTGGIRGSKNNNYEPRSFNMGISRFAFQKSGGFGNIHPGEDPDLSLRLKKMGFKSAFIPQAFVYHKRRIDFFKFKNQVKKFGMVRPILMKWHPESIKTSFFFPSFFALGFVAALLLLFITPYLLLLYLAYFMFLMLHSSLKHRNVLIGLLVIPVVFVQFFGYGTAFMLSYININIFKRNPKKVYPFLFFKK